MGFGFRGGAATTAGGFGSGKSAGKGKGKKRWKEKSWRDL